MLGTEWYISVCGIISWNPNTFLEQAALSKKGSAKDWSIHTCFYIGEQEGYHHTIEASTVKKARILSDKHITSKSTALQKAKIFLPIFS